MKLVVILVFVAAVQVVACQHCRNLNPDKLADSIYVVEGGKKTPYPYGIKSVKTTNPRKVCLNTIKNTYTRWNKAGRPGCYLDFLSDRYCPSSVDPNGNANWKKNIHRLEK